MGKQADSNDEKCIKCTKFVYENQNSICCDKCQGWIHVACSGLKLKEFYKIDDNTKFLCRYCLNSPCGKCDKPVYPKQNGIQCSHDDCGKWHHLRCTHFTLTEYSNRKSRLHTELWYCPECTHLPFDNINQNDLKQLVNDETRLRDYFNILTCNKTFKNNCSVCTKKIPSKNIPKSFPCSSCLSYVHRRCTNISQSDIYRTH